MIDRAGRDSFADVIEGLPAGGLDWWDADEDDWDELEPDDPDTLDPALDAIWEYLYPTSYIWTPQNVREAMGDRETREARCMAFLRSNRPYEWPTTHFERLLADPRRRQPSWAEVLICVPLAGLTAVLLMCIHPVLPLIALGAGIIAWVATANSRKPEDPPPWKAFGDIAAFPFLSHEEYEDELAQQGDR